MLTKICVAFVLCVNTIEAIEELEPVMFGSILFEDIGPLQPLHLGNPPITRRTTTVPTTAMTTMVPVRLARPTDSVCRDLDPPGHTDSWTAGNLSRKLFDIDLRWKVYQKRLAILVAAARLKGLYKGLVVQVRQDGKPVGTLSTKEKNATIISCHPGVNNTAYVASKSNIHFFLVMICWHVPPDYTNTTDYVAHVTVVRKPGLYFKTETEVPKYFNPFKPLETAVQNIPTDSYDWGLVKRTTTRKPVYTKRTHLEYDKFWERNKKHDTYLYYVF